MAESDPDKDGSHPRMIGTIYSEVFIPYELHSSHLVVHMYVILKGTAWNSVKEFKIANVFKIFPVEYYDGLIFSLLRDHYGFNYPTIFGGVYVDRMMVTPCLIMNHVEKEEQLTYDMWKFDYGKNFATRFHLAVLIYFCRMFGVSINMNMIKVKNTVPYIWEIKIIGNPNSDTLPDEILRELYDITDRDWTLLMEGEPDRSLICKRDDSDGFMEYSYKRCYGMDESSIKWKVIEYMRSINIDVGTLRRFLHLRYNDIKSARTVKQTYRTLIPPRTILQFWERNIEIMKGTSPYDIFRRYYE